VTTTRPTAAEAAEARVEESFALAGDGTRLYVRRRAGPSEVTAVLCDGIVCDGFIYKYLWDDLARTLSVAHWNYRAHGRSALPADPDNVGVDAHASDLDAVRRHLGDPPVVLIGHSFGTQVALEAYRLRRRRVRAIVFLCGSYGRITHTFKGRETLANVLPRMVEFVAKHPRLARGLWSRIPARAAVRIAMMTGDVDPHTVRPEDMEPYFQHVAHVDFALFLRMLVLAGEHSAEDLLPGIDVPVLIVAGDKDSFTPPAISEQMAQTIPRADLVMIAGGTHVTPLEQHELVALRIEKFLADRDILR
jgi:pimeloyl-ACP methyl ester carboxylesterase